MDTKSWGPHAWNYLHYISFNFPTSPSNDDINKYLNYYKYFQQTIPCDTCRIDFGKIIDKFPPEKFLKDTEGCVVWTYLIHDLVNQKLNKKSPPFWEIVLFYFKKKASCQNGGPCSYNDVQAFLNSCQSKYEEEFNLSYDYIINNNNNNNNMENLVNNIKNKVKDIYYFISDKIVNSFVCKFIIFILIIIGTNILNYYYFNNINLFKKNDKKIKKKEYNVMYK